jgi:ABC-type uncharacterized transport system fused permease/ATPase subunit
MFVGNLFDKTTRSTSPRREAASECMHSIAEQTLVLLKFSAAFCLALPNSLDFGGFVTPIKALLQMQTSLKVLAHLKLRFQVYFALCNRTSPLYEVRDVGRQTPLESHPI